MNNLPDRILKMCMPIPESGCLVWLGRQEKGGYGQVWWKGKIRLIHRVSYEQAKGKIQDKMTLDHLCRVPSCINPNHLEPVTMKTNILRGNGLAGQNARKTHCNHGHPFSKENTYITTRGERACRECGRRSFREWYKRKLPL